MAGATPRVTPRANPRGTAEAAAAPCPSAAAARAGIVGRFWALLEADDEDDAGDNEGSEGSPHSPTPSDLIGDLFHAGYDEDDVAKTVDTVVPVEDPAQVGLHPDERKELVRRVVHRRNAASAVRPWKGPIPKVCLPKPVLSDFITHNSWKIVRRKKARRSSAATVPAPAIDPGS